MTQTQQSINSSVPELESIKTWLFDLDNTLYPSKSNLFLQVEERIGHYVEKILKLPRLRAKIEQKRMFRNYGSTLRGLMTENQIEPTEFLDYVHDIDYSVLSFDQQLNHVLQALPGRKLIYTNGSKAHANNTLKHLGIEDRIEAVFDIVDANYQPKPNPKPLANLVTLYKVDPFRTLMAEDLVQNLEPAAHVGMKTLWVRTEHAWAKTGNMDCVHYQTDNLASWLNCVLDKN